MSKRSCRNHSPLFKAREALAAKHSENTLTELARQSGVYPVAAAGGHLGRV